MSQRRDWLQLFRESIQNYAGKESKQDERNSGMRFLTIALLLAGAGLVVTLHGHILRYGDFDLRLLLLDIYAQIGVVLLALALALIAIDVLARRRTSTLREDVRIETDTMLRKQFLIQLPASTTDQATALINQVRAHGWITGENALLRGAYLARAQLSGVNLREADMRNIQLMGANLRQAQLWGTDLTNADLRRADLSDSDLSSADLTGAHIAHVNFENARLEGARLVGLDFTGLNLRGAQLIRADLRNSTLVSADLQGANLAGADLRGANLINANIGDALFSETGPDGVYRQVRMDSTTYLCDGRPYESVEGMKRLQEAGARFSTPESQPGSIR